MKNIYECINADCGWAGKYEETVVFKHDKKNKDSVLFCPECNEVVEKKDCDEFKTFQILGTFLGR